MRVLLMSYGSMGDVVPLVALAQALRRRNHQPVFALPRHLVQHVAQFDIEVVPIGPDLGEVFRVAHMQITEGTFTAQAAEQGNQVMAQIGAQALQELAPLTMRSDLIVSLYGMPFVDVIHRATRLPVAVVRVAYPGYETPLQDDTSKPRAPTYGVGSFEPALHLYALSRAVFSPEPGWPDNHHVTGFFFVDDQADSPSAALSAFIEAGPPPAVITMGSMIHSDPARVTKVFLQAIERVGCRAVIQSGWSGLAHNADLPPTMHVADFVPHSWLFPRAAAVVHHGGAGTTAAALRAGVGTVVIPHGLDQFVMAQRVAALGCAGGIIPYQELSAERLAAALTATINTPTIRAAASAASAIVCGERGAEAACDLIEALPPRVRAP